MSLQDKIQALQKLADQLEPIMEREREELIAKAKTYDALMAKCRIRLTDKMCFALEPQVIAHNMVDVGYQWVADNYGLHIRKIVGGQISGTVAFVELHAALANAALNHLDSFVELYIKLAEKRLAALSNSAAPEGAR